MAGTDLAQLLLKHGVTVLLLLCLLRLLAHASAARRVFAARCGLVALLPARLPQGELTFDCGSRMDAGDTPDGDQGVPRSRLSVVRGDSAADVDDPFDPRLRLDGWSDDVGAAGTRG